MPEGDSVFRAAQQLGQALTGQTLQRGEFRHPSLATVDLSGATVNEVRSVGKHLLIRFAAQEPGQPQTPEPKTLAPQTLHSHLRMDGSWQVSPLGARWRLPAHHARVVLETKAMQVVGFRLHDLALLPSREEFRLIGHLGPDLLDPQWTEEHEQLAIVNLKREPQRELGLALLDQRIMAGIGNVFKTEICFRLGVTPWSPTESVDAKKVVELARKLLLFNARLDRRSTTGESANGRRYWVYERTRQGCFRCGGPVRVLGQGDGVQVRPTWFCPQCQQGPVPS